MASSINTNNIDGTFPVAGQDNSSQGFRDNFTNLKTNLGYAKTEVEDLQSKVVLKSPLTGTTLDNDMDGNEIYNVELNRIALKKNSISATTGTLTINWQNGAYQTVTTSGSITLGFQNFPATGKYAELDFMITVANTSHELTLPAAVSHGLDGIPGMTGQVIKFGATGNYLFRFSTDDNGTTITVKLMAGPVVAKQTVTGTATATGAVGDVAGSIKSDGTNLYVCTGAYDGSTVIWKKLVLQAI